MKPRLFGVLFFVCGQAFCSVPDIVYNSVSKLLSACPPEGNEFWDVSRGGYILTLKQDVTGDGIPDMFIAQSMMMSKGNPSWEVYRAMPDGRYDRFQFVSERKDAVAEFGALHISSIDYIFVSSISGGAVLYDPWHNKYADEGRYWGVDCYRINGNKVRASVQQTDEKWSSAVYEGDPHEISINSTVSGMLIADLLRHPDTKWRSMNMADFIDSPAGQWVHKDDAARLERMAAFTPELARKWLKTARLGKEPEGDTSAYDLPSGTLQPIPTGPDETSRVSFASTPVIAAQPPFGSPSPAPETLINEAESVWLERLRSYPPGAVALVLAGALAFLGYGITYLIRIFRNKERVRFSR
ncbi:MAG: hypothetical protein WCO60_07460 [Verrucomicrobiota bacterium]